MNCTACNTVQKNFSKKPVFSPITSQIFGLVRNLKHALVVRRRDICWNGIVVHGCSNFVWLVSGIARMSRLVQSFLRFGLTTGHIVAASSLQLNPDLNQFPWLIEDR
eukprot:scaffold7103_cov146-Alexandrium_tamarense.AAC.2